MENANKEEENDCTCVNAKMSDQIARFREGRTARLAFVGPLVTVDNIGLLLHWRFNVSDVFFGSREHIILLTSEEVGVNRGVGQSMCGLTSVLAFPSAFPHYQEYANGTLSCAPLHPRHRSLICYKVDNRTHRMSDPYRSRN